MLAKIFPQNIVPRLQAIYDKVEDVDLFVGGLLETAEEVQSIFLSIKPKLKLYSGNPWAHFPLLGW